MDFKKTNAARSTITRNTNDMCEQTDNMYETLNILSRRANQIGSAMKEELTSKLAEFAPTTDNLEEIFENREQIEISKFYERLPKATAIAIQEYMQGETYFRNPDTGSSSSPDVEEESAEEEA